MKHLICFFARSCSYVVFELDGVSTRNYLILSDHAWFPPDNALAQGSCIGVVL